MCDRAVALPCAHADPALDRAVHLFARRWTRAGLAHSAHARRQRLRLFLDHLSDEQALTTLQGQLEGKVFGDPNFVRFRAGHVRRFWIGNCVAIGLSAGFLEPLESTSISLIQMGIDKLLTFWPDESIAPSLIDEYNRISIAEYERIRDFIILHYSANGRQSGNGKDDLWRYCREMPLPDTLSRKLDMYRERGLIRLFDSESFFQQSWLCMFGNLGIEAGSWDPLTNLLPLNELDDIARRVRADIVKIAHSATPHREFLKQAGAFAT